jgi:hypothetical protein
MPNTECGLSTTEIVQRKCNISTVMEDLDPNLHSFRDIVELVRTTNRNDQTCLGKGEPGPDFILGKGRLSSPGNLATQVNALPDKFTQRGTIVSFHRTIRSGVCSLHDLNRP